MRKRSWLDRLLGEKSRRAPDAPRPGDALYFEPKLRRLEDRRVLAGDIAVNAGTDQGAILEGTTVALSAASFSDADPGGQAHTAEINWGDGSPATAGSIDESTGTITGTHTYQDDGNYTVSVTVTGTINGDVGQDTALVQINNANPTNLALIVATPPVYENGEITLTGTFDDAGALDAHSVKVDWGDGSAPTVISLAPNVLTFMATHQYLDDPAGATNAYSIGVTVFDDDGAFAGDFIGTSVDNLAPSNVNINLLPSPGGEGSSVTLSGTFEDAGTLDTHTAFVDWGDGSPTEQLSLVEPTAGNPGTFGGLTHTYLNDGNYNVKVTVSDDEDGTEASQLLAVQNVAPANLALSIAPSTINENSQVTLTGSFDDPGILDGHTVTIAWGDGATTTFTLAPNVTTFSQTHTYVDDPPPAALSDIYSVAVTVEDDGGLSTSGTADVQVDNVAPSNLVLSVDPAVIDENGEVTLTGTFIETGSADSYTVEINWGDGSANTLFTLAPGSTTFTKTHIYLDDPAPAALTDTFAIQVTVKDDDTGTATALSTVEVLNVDPEIVQLTLSDATIDENGTINLTGILKDIGSLDAHEIEIDWGDGTVETIQLNPAEEQFSLSHQYLDDGLTSGPTDDYTILVSVADDDGGVAAASTIVTVANVAPVITQLSITPVFENQTATLSGTYSDTGPLDTHTVDIDWDGDGTFDELGLAVSGGQFTFSHLYADDNPTGTGSDTFPVTVRLHDDDGGLDQKSVDETVFNLSPSLTNLSATSTSENGATTLTGTISDPSPEDSFTLVVDWGDPNSPSNLQTFSFAPGTTSFSLTHTYLDDNPSGTSSDDYIVTATLFDDDLGFSGSPATVTVQNVAPTLIDVTGSTIDENGTATVAVTIDDPGTLDVFSVNVDWQDGTAADTISGLGAADASGTVGTTGYAWVAATRELTLTHLYLDDGVFPGNGTASDTYAVALTVSDDDLGTNSTTATVFVNNVAPQLVNVTGSTIDENDVATVSATISDVGTTDVFAVGVDWQDGTPVDTITGLGLTDSAGTVGGTSYVWIAATRELTLTHQYLDDGAFPGNGTGSDAYSVVLSVSDDDLGTSDATATVVVNNITPQLVSVTGSTIDENGVATVAITISDAGTQDVFDVTVDWQDGTSADAIAGLGLTDSSGTVGGTSYVWIAATRELTLTHQYLDDGAFPGNGTANDTYTVALSVSDDDLGSTSTTATVIVNNVTPQLIAVSGSTIGENGVATVSATVSDAGTQEVFDVTADWQDGTPADTITGLGLTDSSGTVGATSFTWVAATRQLTLTHQYLDDGAFPGNGTASDTYTVALSVSDDDLGTSNTTATVVVNNVTPQLVTVTGSTINENGVATVSATISDAGTQDVFEVTVDWQDGTPADTITGLGLTDSTGTVGTTSFTWTAASRQLTLTHQYLDDGTFPGNGTASDTYAVALSVSDDDLGTSNTTATVVVSNVTPQLVTVTGSTIDENGVATVSATVSDPGTQDVFSVTVDWQDGTPADTITGLGLTDSSGTVGGTNYSWTAATRQLTLTHPYLDDGAFPGNGTATDTYTVALAVHDDDLGTSSTTATVVVNNVTPQLVTVTGSTIDENGVATVSATVADPGTQDIFDVTVNWQDGTPADTISGLGLTDSSGTVGGTNYTWTAATRQLSLTHQYVDDGTFPGNGTASDAYAVALSVNDDDLGSSSTTATVIVNNVAPQLVTVTGSTINENDVATVSATVNDPGTQDVFDVTVDWQDGTPADTITGLGLSDTTGTVGTTSYTWVAATRQLTFTHQYLDDGTFPGNGTASDTYTIALSVNDDDLGTSNTIATVIVNNVTPQLVTVTGSTVDENGVATVSATINDAGTQDVFDVTVNWQDGTPADTITGLELTDSAGTIGGTSYTWIATTRQLTLAHQYLDDGTSPGNGTASDTYTVALSVNDDDLGTSNTTATVVVNNVTPQLVTVTGSTINENGTATVTAAINDPGTQDVFDVTVNWQDGTPADTITGLGLTDSSGTIGGTSYTWIAATRSLTLTHQYLDDGTFPGNGTASDTYTVALAVNDDDLGTSSTTATVIVNNVTPQLVTVTGSTINENGVASVTATVSDPGTQDVFDVTINWQDGSPADTITGLGLTDSTGTVGTTSYTWVAATRQLTLTHQYIDDGTFPGNGTASDTYTVALAINDDDLGASSTTATVIVNNVAPQLINVVGATINEDSVATISATLSDPGTQDLFVVSVDWQDGTPVDTLPVLGLVDASGTVGGTTYVWIAATRSLTLSHQYLDDGTFPGNGTASDTYAVALSVSDDDLGASSTTASVIVNNVAPSDILFTATPAVINEHNSVTISGTFVDTGRQDQHTLMVDWGDGTPPEAINTFTSTNGQGTFTATHFYFDDNGTGTPTDINVIRVFVTDDDLGTGVGQFNLTVHDVAPVIGTLSATQLDNTGKTTLTGTFSDVGTQDTFQIVIDWKDGTIETIDMPAGSTSFTVDHFYNAPPDPANPTDDIPVLITVVDDDTLSAAGIALVDVPGKNVFGSFVDLAPKAEPLQFPVVVNISNTPLQVPPPLGSSRTLIDRRTAVDINVGAHRRIILRTVSIHGEEENEVSLPEEQLDDLTALFRRLPDGRYRIYLRQDKVERLILDVHIRQGKPVDPGDENDGTRDRPPTSQAEPNKALNEVIQEAGVCSEEDSVAKDSEVLDEKVNWSQAARPIPQLDRRANTC